MKKKIIGIFVCTLLIVMILPVNGSTNFSENRLFPKKIGYEKNSNDLKDNVNWWPMFMHDPSHSGYIESEGPDTCNYIWGYSISYSSKDEYQNFDKSSPAIFDGRVYIGSKSLYGWNGYLACIDADSGKEI